MNEKAIRLYNGVTHIDDALIEEAQDARETRRGKAARAWLKWGMAAACAALLVVLALPQLRDAGSTSSGSSGGASGYAGGDGSGVTTDGGVTPEADGGTGLRPQLLVNGKLYYFLEGSGAWRQREDGKWVSQDRSVDPPETFTEYGALSSVTRDEPTEELQLRGPYAGAVGTVYTSAEYPEAVYVRLSTDTVEDAYLRFGSEALGFDEQLSWHGRMYRLTTGLSEIAPVVPELPGGAEPAGTLRYIGANASPSDDLETNCRRDAYLQGFDGREVYAIPGDDSVLYVYERQYWSGGEYDAWRACHPWEWSAETGAQYLK